MHNSDLHVDPALLYILMTVGVVIFGAGLARLARQPVILAYVLSGLLLGPPGLGLITDAEVIQHMGSVGIVILLFLVGSEISVATLVTTARRSATVAVGQLTMALFGAAIVGWMFHWPMHRSIVVGFVLSLASTAIVARKLSASGQTHSKFGSDLLGVLIVEDILAVPMLVAVAVLAGSRITPLELTVQVAGGAVVIAFVGWLVRHPRIRSPFGRAVHEDRELQVLVALGVCCGCAVATSMVGLSAPLGAFVAGLAVGQMSDTHWVAGALHPFQVVFMALFFMSIGMSIDPRFVAEHLLVLFALATFVLLGLTTSRSVLFRLTGRTWAESWRRACALAQVGELGFLIAAVALNAGVIVAYGYQTIISLITFTIILSPVWIRLSGLLDSTRVEEPGPAELHLVEPQDVSPPSWDDDLDEPEREAA